MTDSQMDAPERIWAWYWNGKTYSGQWHVAPTSILDANLYILATPTALAADPAVKALVAEAEARGMERAWPTVRKVICSKDWTDTDGDVFCEVIENAIRAEALLVREGKTA